MSPTVMLQLEFCIWQEFTVLTMMGRGIHVQPGCDSKSPDVIDTMDAEEFIAAVLVCTMNNCRLLSTRVGRKLCLHSSASRARQATRGQLLVLPYVGSQVHILQLARLYISLFLESDSEEGGCVRVHFAAPRVFWCLDFLQCSRCTHKIL